MKKLTELEAIEKSIELWTFLAETGKEKEAWDGWDEAVENIPRNRCYLCQYREEQGAGCEVCPYYKKFGCCYSKSFSPDTIFEKWEDAATPAKRKKYAVLFLAQLEQLLPAPEPRYEPVHCPYCGAEVTVKLVGASGKDC